MFKKLFLFASFSVLAVVGAQAQNITLYGESPVYKGGSVGCSPGTAICATIEPKTTLESGLGTIQQNGEATIKVFLETG